ncbi:hypothetical protein [Arenimonas daejeonensis]|uniref:hypothetical protein n=1 Tax=Arenimonas daejeonensis TaxID=370777 RepID=UPI0011BEB0E1|nr:hypothetical protein [Arenimonas daejeonensis]
MLKQSRAPLDASDVWSDDFVPARPGITDHAIRPAVHNLVFQFSGKDMRNLSVVELGSVMGGGTGGELAASCAAGAGAAATGGAIAGVVTGGVGLAAAVLGGCAGGILLYYITD